MPEPAAGYIWGLTRASVCCTQVTSCKAVHKRAAANRARQLHIQRPPPAARALALSAVADRMRLSCSSASALILSLAGNSDGGRRGGCVSRSLGTGPSSPALCWSGMQRAPNCMTVAALHVPKEHKSLVQTQNGKPHGNRAACHTPMQPEQETAHYGSVSPDKTSRAGGDAAAELAARLAAAEAVAHVPSAAPTGGRPRRVRGHVRQRGGDPRVHLCQGEAACHPVGVHKE